jgi:hypothetical protein
MYINNISGETLFNVPRGGVSFPKVLTRDMLNTLGYSEVEMTEYPPTKRGRVITEGPVVETNGVYYQTWSIDDSNVDPMMNLKITRDKRLTSSDHTQATDTTQTVTDKEAWAVYRQELRDLPATYASNPEEVVWPTSPSVILDVPANP